MLVQDTSGLAEGISQAGTALGNALQQISARRQQEKQRKALAPMFDEDSTLGKIVSQPGGLQMLQSMGGVLGPLIKEEQRAKNVNAINDRWTPIEEGGDKTQPDMPIQQAQPEPQDNTLLESIVGPQTEEQAQQGQPIQQAQQQPEASPLQQIQQANQEIPEEKDVVQTKGGSYPSDEFFETPFGKFHPKQLEELMNSPYQENRQKADTISKFLVQQENLQGKENIQQRKEWRASINKFSEKFEDMPTMKLNRNRLERAKKMIEDDKINLGDNWFRNVSGTVLGEKGLPELKELLKTSDQKLFYNLIYPFIKPKEMGGSNPSTREVLMALQAQPSELKGKEANLEIINRMLLTANSDLEKGSIANEVRGKPGTISYGRFLNEVNEGVSERIEPLEKKYALESLALEKQKEFKNTPAGEGNMLILSPLGAVERHPAKDRKFLESQGGIFIK